MLYATTIVSWLVLFEMTFNTITVIYIYFNTDITCILSDRSWKCLEVCDILWLQPTKYYKFWTFEIKTIFILHCHILFLVIMLLHNWYFVFKFGKWCYDTKYLWFLPAGIFIICISTTTSYISGNHNASLSLLILLVTTILTAKKLFMARPIYVNRN